MSLFLSIFIALQLGLGLGLSGFNFSTAKGQEIPNTEHAEASCPLNFDILNKIGSRRPSFITVPKQCRNILAGIHLVRSEYLRTRGYFLPPSNTSEACWDLYRNLIIECAQGFDIRSACGNHSEWISEGCMNITSRSQFETLIPESVMQEIRRFCGQSLDDSTLCGLCRDALTSLRASYLRIPELGNVSADCTGYPFMYAAALINRFGPTDVATAKCLFSLEFSNRPSRISQHTIVISGVVIGCVIGFLGAFASVWFLWVMHRKWEKEEEKRFVKIERSLVSRLGSINGSIRLVRFEFEEIRQATVNFSRENIIGKGRYGNVYKGVLPDGSEVALKRFKNCTAFGDDTFAHEVEVIASVWHMNLVALRGYCTATIPMEGHQRIIVCDLMHNGSLHDHLFGDGVKKLNWPIRQKIALGTARGLAYLHYGAQPAIIHRDVKASNILLDENFEPKLADFGLAKFTSEGTTHLSTKVAGTLGYVAPEYALYGQLTERSDVYSFGVVLLELLSGKKALISTNEGQNSLLTDWAWSLVNEGRQLDIIEEGMPELGLPTVMEKYVFIAVLCSHPILHARPTMDQIAKIMETNLPVSSLLGPSVASSKREMIETDLLAVNLSSADEKPLSLES